ncbi:uncharacterized protein LOC109810338 [Cajanus cajan]|uniref:uncharacterized protein LOC109810338 n=1 Tax=Cajanus cajan TaxID=3821 RepID=UPI00098DB658|nr:uncharacterized protein LOC109810338 [Cajanus cajan]XP_029129621.1 uncharacterized protein LOC109810338 [Cajanus cajan]XP_029129622.1 uncharacterized protein LOC109810338 [Cajanus cajan]
MNSKPSLDGFLAAAKRFEGGPVDPCNILVFEDAPSGVLVAKNAGMSVVMVPYPRLDKSFHEAADQVLNSLLDFMNSLVLRGTWHHYQLECGALWSVLWHYLEDLSSTLLYLEGMHPTNYREDNACESVIADWQGKAPFLKMKL